MTFIKSKTKVVKYILAGLVFIFILFASEFIYIVNQKNQVYVLYHLFFAQKLVDRLGPQRSLDLIAKGTKINLDKVAKSYSPTLQPNYNPQVDISSMSEEFKQTFVTYVKQLDIRLMASREESDLARVYYTLGLLAYKNNESDLTPRFFQTALLLNPELSHFHIELSNYYLSQGNEEGARGALELCSKFKYANEHCQDYLDNNFFWKVPEQVGFLEKEVKNHYEKS